MTDDTPTASDADARSLHDRLAEVDRETLERFSSFAKANQFKSVFARNLHLANWFEALGDIVRDEIKRRDGKGDDAKVADPDTHLSQRTEVMTGQELEALGMGFASLMSAVDEKEDMALASLVEAIYEPVRLEYLKRHDTQVFVGNSDPD